MRDMEALMVHHHRSALKKGHKSFKTKHLSKSALKAKAKGKVEKSSAAQKPKVTLRKQDRRNQAKQIMLSKREEMLSNKKFFDGRNGAPRIVAVIPLCPDVDVEDIVNRLNASVLDAHTRAPFSGPFTVPVERFKQKIEYIVAPRHFASILDAAQAADFVVFALSAKQEVDRFGETCLRSIVAQGVSSVYTVVQHLATVESAKMQTELRKSLLSYITHFFAEQDKIFAADSNQDCLNLTRFLCQQFPKGVQWRDTRSYMLADKTWYEPSQTSAGGSGLLALQGVIRGKKLSADRLVHIPGCGDFQIEKIVGGNVDSDVNSMDADTSEFTGNFVVLPSADQDDLDELSPEEMRDDNDAMAMESMYSESRGGMQLDDHFDLPEDDSDFDDDERTASLKDRNRIPKGMSEYQARWVIEENSDDEFESGEDSEDNAQSDNNDMQLDDDYVAHGADAYGTMSELDTQSEMFVDLSPEEEARQLKAFRERERADNEFPDEVELRPDESAKNRFARYRGLRSLRSSPWNADETDAKTPTEWSRLARFQNFTVSRRRALKEASVAPGVPAGTRAVVYLRAPASVYASVVGRPFVAVYSLLRYEHKMVVLNVSVTPNTEYDDPIPSKDDLILQCGPRRYKVNPIFSEAGAMPNNVSKVERFLHQGHTAIASMIAPISFGNTPVLLLKDIADTKSNIELVAFGSVINADHSRVSAKRIIITGYPFKIHKKLVTVRYMFFNAEDVLWFKAIPLFTKMGRSGFIKDKIGTHGYFKCTFDGPLNAQDTIGMALYKRVWPRPSSLWVSAY
ncbi:uncharacterized protein V1518DRAFT_428016 [Limtongia smithiae]|uniref:uncharacterized protein n=1 Tax=Limtongia smithiae TaxID=1125753 RepID=UPI0034CF815B